MAITKSGLYFLNLEKMMIDTLGVSLELETNKTLMVTDTEAPNFLTHDFRDDLLAEITGTNYTVGGVTQTGTEVTGATTILTFDMADTVFSNITINSANAMAGVHYTNVGTAATDQIIVLQDFVTAADATAADFTIQHAGTGVFTLDFAP